MKEKIRKELEEVIEDAREILTNKKIPNRINQVLDTALMLKIIDYLDLINENIKKTNELLRKGD